MKRLSIGIVIGLIVGFILTTTTFVLAEQPIKLIVNGKEIQSDVPPQVINGRTMVPARFLAEALGAKAEWDAANNAVIVTSQVQISGIPGDLPQVKQKPANNHPSNGEWIEGYRVNGKELSTHTMGWATPDNFFMEEKALNLVLDDLGLPSVSPDYPNQDVWHNAWYFISLKRLNNIRHSYDAEKMNLVISNIYAPSIPTTLPISNNEGWISLHDLAEKYNFYVGAGDNITLRKGNKEIEFPMPKTLNDQTIIISITPLLHVKIVNERLYLSINELRQAGFLP